MDRHFQLFLQTTDQHIGIEWGNQTCHVLDTEAVDTHTFEFFGLIDEHLNRMDRTGGVAQGPLGMFSNLPDGLDRGFQIPQVVECVEDSKHVHAVGGSPLHKCFNHVIGIVRVAK